MIDFGSVVANSVFGGAIMALASSLHLYLQGKITGISGSIFKFLTCKDVYYNCSFLLGMVFMSSFIKCFFLQNVQKTQNSSSFLETSNEFVADLSLGGFILAGFLVGFGAKMGNGCTSGHGVCGLPRLSKRSIVAISLFMIFGITLATLKYYFQFLIPGPNSINTWDLNFINYFVFFSVCMSFVYIIHKDINNGKRNVRDMIISFLIGSLFSFGLIESGMLQRHVVLGFLTIGKIWNIQLAFVLGTAVGINLLTFNFILKKISKPRYKEKYDLPTNKVIDNKLCLGAAIFGIGWGLSGICPGPAVLTLCLYCPQTLAFFIALCTGIYIESVFDSKISDILNKNSFISRINKFQVLNDNDKQ